MHERSFHEALESGPLASVVGSRGARPEAGPPNLESPHATHQYRIRAHGTEPTRIKEGLYKIQLQHHSIIDNLENKGLYKIGPHTRGPY